MMLTPPAAAAGDLELCAAVAAILAEEAEAAAGRGALAMAHGSAGCRSAGASGGLSFRQGQRSEQEIDLHYGSGPAT